MYLLRNTKIEHHRQLNQCLARFKMSSQVMWKAASFALVKKVLVGKKYGFFQLQRQLKGYILEVRVQ